MYELPALNHVPHPPLNPLGTQGWSLPYIIHSLWEHPIRLLQRGRMKNPTSCTSSPSLHPHSHAFYMDSQDQEGVPQWIVTYEVWGFSEGAERRSRWNRYKWKMLNTLWSLRGVPWTLPAASKPALHWNHRAVSQPRCSAHGLMCCQLALPAWASPQLSPLAEEARKKQSPREPGQRHCHLQLLIWFMFPGGPTLAVGEVKAKPQLDVIWV